MSPGFLQGAINEIPGLFKVFSRLLFKQSMVFCSLKSTFSDMITSCITSTVKIKTPIESNRVCMCVDQK